MTFGVSEFIRIVSILTIFTSYSSAIYPYGYHPGYGCRPAFYGPRPAFRPFPYGHRPLLPPYYGLAPRPPLIPRLPAMVPRPLPPPRLPRPGGLLTGIPNLIRAFIPPTGTLDRVLGAVFPSSSSGQFCPHCSSCRSTYAGYGCPSCAGQNYLPGPCCCQQCF